MLAFSLLTLVAASTLMFSSIELLKGEDYHSYNQATLSLEQVNLTIMPDNTLLVTGCSYDDFLLCNRAGELFFPHNRGDQSLSYSFEVQTGDELYWIKFNNGAPKCFYRLFTSPSLRNFLDFKDDAKTLYHFKIIEKQINTLNC